MNPTHQTVKKHSLIEKKVNKGVNILTEFSFSSLTHHYNLISDHSQYILFPHPNFRHTRTISLVYKIKEE